MAKIEVIKQHDLKDCGACSLLCIIKYYNGYVPLEKIRDDTLTGLNGTSAYNLIEASKIYGFESIGVKVESIFDQNIYLPSIAHLKLKNGLEHFVVVYKITKNHIWLMDPAKGKVKMSINEFTAIWDNILILLSPLNNNIVSYEKEITITSVVTNLLKNNKSIFCTILIINILFIALSIIGNFYFQIAVSSINTGTDSTFLKFIIILFFIIFLFKVLINYVKTSYLNYLNKNLDVTIFTEFLDHIFNLPLKFMQNRTTGEITSRVGELEEIKNFLAEIFSNVILNSILLLGSIVVLYGLNAKLFFILFLVVSIYIFIGLIFSRVIYKHLKKNIEVATDFNTTLVENIEMNASIKNLNLIDEFNHHLEDKVILMLKKNFELQNFFNKIELLKNFIYEIGLFCVSTFGIYLIFHGELELLTLITFNSLIIYLFNPLKEMIDLIPKYNYLKASFSKLSEFINIKREENNEGLENIENNSLEVKDLSYSYNKFSNILNHVSFKINSGEKVLIFGASGSGKSTICKLLYRYLDGYLGNINFDNTSEKDYCASAIRNNILYVGQNEKLFTGTVKENILCFRNIPEKEFKTVTKICKIEEIVCKKPNRYNSIINASLNNLSGGEKQRIILARALLKKSKIIILDEALSEVNIEMEKEILDAIFKHYHSETLIYVSHKNVLDKFKKVINIGELKNDQSI